jgi:hypothetical protein
MLGTELVVMATLCFASADSYMSINSSYVEDNHREVGILMCGQSVISNYFNFFEGGLLCLRD